MSISIHESIKAIPHYPKAQMYGMDEGWVRLSSNENPFPPSPQVISKVLEALFFMNRYPGGEYDLKEALAEKYKVKPGQVLIGNGSNELIEMALRAMRNDGKNKVIIPEPSFAFYSIASKIYGYEVLRAPLVNMQVDLRIMSELVDDRTRVIFLNNPNNPTGTIFTEEAFKNFLTELPPDALIVMDEAYAEFVESKTFPHTLDLINDYPILTLRTFSKAYGLAGLRVGYGIGEESLISFLERTKQPFSVNMVALAAARTALTDEQYLKKVLNNNRKGKRYLYASLKGMSLQFIPTEANFILIRIGKGAERISKKLFKENILVRWMGAYGLPDYIRVSIGRTKENTQFIEAMRRALEG